MRVKRAAAALPARHVHVVTLGVKHTGRRGVDVAEHDARDTAGDHGDTRAITGQVLGRPIGRRPRRRDLLQRSQRARCRKPAEKQCRSQPPPVRKDGEDAGAHKPVERPSAMVLLDVVAGLLDQPVVLHTRRARRNARHAAETPIEVFDDGVAQRDRPVHEALHQVDAPARRVHLLVPEGIGGARREAEAAVDAVCDQLGLHIASRTRWASGLHTGSRASWT